MKLFCQPGVKFWPLDIKWNGGVLNQRFLTVFPRENTYLAASFLRSLFRNWPIFTSLSDLNMKRPRVFLNRGFNRTVANQILLVSRPKSIWVPAPDVIS